MVPVPESSRGRRKLPCSAITVFPGTLSCYEGPWRITDTTGGGIPSRCRTRKPEGTTGIDSLAVAVGNAHGDYKFPPKLDSDRIETIAGKTGMPLVLHGGNGLSDSDFRTAVQRGICKVHIFTDIDKAGKAGIEEGLAAGAASMMALFPYETEAMKQVMLEQDGAVRIGRQMQIRYISESN